MLFPIKIVLIMLSYFSSMNFKTFAARLFPLPESVFNLIFEEQETAVSDAEKNPEKIIKIMMGINKG